MDANRGRRTADRPLKNPLAVATDYAGPRGTAPHADGMPALRAYAAPGRHLDKWLTSRGIDGDFTVVDTALLNRYFRECGSNVRTGPP